MYEANDIVKNIEFLDKNARELDRYKLYVAIQSNSKKKIDVEDVMKLPWDKSEVMKRKHTEPQADNEQKYNDMAKWYLDAMKEGKIKFEEAKLM